MEIVKRNFAALGLEQEMGMVGWYDGLFTGILFIPKIGGML